MKGKKAILVTTEHRGVFFGYIKAGADISAKSLSLENARNCIYWRGIKGFLALAETGPTNDCRIGPKANIVLHDITCVAECTNEAVAAWEKAPW